MQTPKSLASNVSAKPLAICDWYDASLPTGDYPMILSELAAALGCKVNEIPGKNGYERGFQLFDLQQGVHNNRCQVFTDFPDRRGGYIERTYISANGSSGGLVRDFLNECNVTHQVKRYDSAIDLKLTDRQFLRRARQMAKFCAGLNKHHHPQGTVENGRTYYYNTRVKTALTSKNQKLPEAQIAFYEKAKQLQMPISQGENWCRLEMRWRPDKPESRDAAAFVEPSDVWGAFEWTQTMVSLGTGGASAVDRIDLPRFKQSLPEVAEELRKIRAMKTLQHLSSQYGRTYDTLVELCGEDEADRLVLSAFKREREAMKPASEIYAELYETPTTH